jgi:hypothetical protein
VSLQPAGRVYADWDRIAVIKGSLRHTDADGETLTVQTAVLNDMSQDDQPTSSPVSLDGEQGTEFYVGRAGEAAEITITGAGQKDFALSDLRLFVDGQGHAGDVRK